VKRNATILIFSVLTIFLFSIAPINNSSANADRKAFVSVYFPNWNIFSQDYAEVKHLPWDRIDRIYHAFWKIVKEGNDFVIRSSDPWADTDSANAKAHFSQYAQYSSRFPNTEILLSIGGWTYSGLFSQMALSQKSRASFINSCIETLIAYPFLDGIDLDWEYPGVARKGSTKDEGNPVAGDDFTNYTLLLKEMREAFDDAFGAGIKKITVCAAGGLGNLKKQDYPSLHPYVDAINLMTYDLIASKAITAHHSPLYGQNSADTAVNYLLSCGVPAEKIFIGTPLYNHGWKISNPQQPGIGMQASGANYGGTMLWKTLRKFETSSVPAGTPGWHTGYDESAQAAYLWNDDPNASHYASFLSYENSRSLDAKLNYITAGQLGGIIVWQAGGDDASAGWPMITQMHKRFSAQKD